MGEPWRGRYDRLHLHTIRSLSHLPGYRIPREFGRWVARDQFVQYLEQYAAHHRLVPRLEVEATRIDRDDGHWSVRTTTGTIPARVVVVATGYTRLPQLPRWPGTFDGPVIHSVEYRNPQPYRDQDVLIVGAGNSGTEIAVDLAEGGARRVRIAVRTPPNILRRDVKGFPIQLLGIVFRRLPPRLLDQLVLVLERATVPNLSAWGLPRPSAPFSQFRHTGTVPIIDVGFVDAVRSGVIEVVPGVPRSTAGQSCSPMDHACFRTPLWRPPDTTLGSSRWSAISQRSESTVFQARNRVCISSECASQSPGCCARSALMPDRSRETWRANLAP